MKNITINLPEIYEKNIQWLITHRVVNNRSEAVRLALKDYLREEIENLELLGYDTSEIIKKLS